MARIRSIHPGLCTDEAYMEMSIVAKAAWPLLWTACDDHGAFDWKPKGLKAAILPADNVDMLAILEEWKSLGVIRLVEIDGKPCGLVKNFCRFQSPKFPSYRYEITEDMLKFVAWKPKKSGKADTSDDDDSGSTTEEPDAQPNPPTPILPQGSGSSAVALPHGEERRGEESKERKKELATLVARGDDGFEAFWQAYPRKVGKGAVIRMWPGIMKKTSVTAVLMAISTQSFDHRERFIPHPATWLNQERWLDEAQTGDPVLRAAGLSDDGEIIQKPEELPGWLQLPGGRA